MSFNTRVLWGLIALVVIVGAVWYVAMQHLNPLTTPTTSIQDAATTSQEVPASDTQSASLPTLDLQSVQSNIVGSWQSTQDANYKIAITAGGKWTDSYGSDAGATETGKYTLFTSKNPDKDFTGILQPDIVYVKVVEGSSTLYFSVLEADAQGLQLSYLDRGNTLSFARIQ